MEARKALDVRQIVSSRKQQLKFLTRTHDNKLVFQGVLDGAIVTTDLEGYRVDSKNKITTQKIAFNASPDDIVVDSAKIRFKTGDVVFTLRPMSKRCKVYAGVVTGYSNGGVRVKVEGIPPNAWTKHKVKDDGTISVPTRLTFSNRQEVLDYVNSYSRDLEKAMVDYMRLDMTRTSAEAQG